LVRSLVDLHGGTVEARSEGPGRGTEFLVKIPLTTENLGDSDAGGPEDQIAAFALHRILVVDDNRDSAESLSILLRFLGSDVYTVHDGAAALEAVRAYQPSVVLLDIGLPGMDGHEVARRLRRLSECRDVVLIALTGWGQESDRRLSKEAGFDHHLVKP